MGLSSLQVCMDTSEWMQGTVHEERGVDSPPLEEMFTCSRPLLERRLRPQPDPALKCPRCDSTNTKFCYYNNYSLSQPRYFCKTCRRYWTKGGSLRNVPVGGGCRKNKRVAVKKTQDQGQNQLLPPSSSSQEGTDLHLSFSGVQLSHLDTMFGTGNPRNYDFMEGNMLGNPRGHDFMETKFGIGHLGGHEGKYYGTELGALCEGLGSGEMGFVGGNSDVNNHGLMGSGFHGFCSSLGMNNGGYIEGGGRLDFPFEYENRDEMKPRIHVSDNQSNKPLCIEWQEHDNCEGSKDPSGYWSGLGTWSGLMNNCGTSSALPLVQNLD